MGLEHQQRVDETIKRVRGAVESALGTHKIPAFLGESGDKKMMYIANDLQLIIRDAVKRDDALEILQGTEEPLVRISGMRIPLSSVVAATGYAMSTGDRKDFAGEAAPYMPLLKILKMCRDTGVLAPTDDNTGSYMYEAYIDGLGKHAAGVSIAWARDFPTAAGAEAQV